ncbi:peptidase S41 [Aliidiomarina halalkaliphila]|uniref:Tricorn protease homolog n=1 Tax=Aliidiomarina halalkaliphila TaxID=2593535 RepID=A0A552WZP1_9GAMM|nr:S41 family peptidase [Aliidiomarina halalkaliphila]TRW48282.1 peptidase S41 [Aliidiomarina halalkaliphila]
MKNGSRRTLSALSALFVALSCASVTASEAEQGYYRAPAIFQDTVIFTAEGDLWKTHLDSNVTRRLTRHAAEELGARISPDGQFVAYVANYEGAPEIYVLPMRGGVPKRVSFENSRVRMQGWSSDGQVLYSTDNIVGPANQWVMRQVHPDTLETTTFPLIDAIEGQLDTQGEHLYFTRFGLQATGDNAKVYRGGARGEIWRYTTGTTQEATHLTAEHQGSAKRPMLWQDRVYFISDADGTPNIWSMTSHGRDFKQHTHYNDWQVWDANLHNGRIVYQHGADIRLFDIDSERSQTLTIGLASDFTQRQERWLDDPMDYLTDVTFGGDDQVVLTARSQVAVASTGQRRVAHIQTPEASRSRFAVISPDGEWVYAVNDHSGENEIWRFPADGSSGAEQLTTDGHVFRWNIHVSPDGRYLAHHNHLGHLYLLNLATGENTQIFAENMPSRGYPDVHWSADSSLLSFTIESRHEPQRHQVVVYHLDSGEHALVTSDKYESYSPAFSQDGHWLYFLSDRVFTPTPSSPWGDRNMGPMFDKRTQIFAVSLKPDACFPFAPPAEIRHCDDEKAGEQSIRLDGIQDRLWQVPVSADNYFNLAANEDRLYVQAREAGWGNSPTLYSIAFSNDEAKRETFANNVVRYSLSNDGKRLFYQQTGAHNLFIVNAGATAPNDIQHARVATRQWQIALSPVQEWRQMFRDAWLMHRDYLFDPNMRGVDWTAMYERYSPLVDRLTDRHELDDLFAQMMSELNVLHSQVRGGDYSQPRERTSAATLGAQLTATRDGVRIETIYRVDPELPQQAAPLAAPGVDAQEGDLITQVNGRDVSNPGEVLHALRGTANKQVLLTLNRNGTSLQTVVTPVDGNRDHRLRYETWVQNNRDRVSEASDGRYGYLHLYAMGANDISSFAREFYANFQKEGLIIDVRRNRGGNIDSWVLEKLMRRAWSFWQRRGGSDSFTNMQQAFSGQLVVLADQLTYSDGETFSAGVKALNLGPVVGKRTAGAGVWLSDRNRLADRGSARVAELGQFAVDGRWIVEGYGVAPDIEVDNLPLATFQGTDAQLERALEVLHELVKQSPRPSFTPGPLTAPIADDVR